jgi:hypothetical protein
MNSLKIKEDFYLLSLHYIYDCNILDTYLLDTITYNISDLTLLSATPRAIPFLRRNMDRIQWGALSLNAEALDFLESFPENIDYISLSSNRNPRAMKILRENLDKVNWSRLSGNPCNEAIDILIENPQNINYEWMSINTNPRAIDILKNNNDIHEIRWYGLSSNSCYKAVQLLTEHPNNINWDVLCRFAETKEQFALIRANLGCVEWDSLCSNPSELAVKLLEEHPDKIHWVHSLKSQNIFETITTYDYAGIRGARRDLHQEFHAWAGHPSMITKKWKDWGFDTYGLDETDETF